MDAEEADRKRPRIEYEQAAARDLESKNYVNHPELYLDDGNIILKCKASVTIFRIHRSILAKHSPVFEQQFTLAISAPSPVKFRDCYFIEVEDDLDDLDALLRTVYEGFQLSIPAELNVESFPAFAGLLRITTKYKIDRVRQLLLSRLHDEWPSTLEKHIEKVVKFSASYTARAGADDIIVHPASVIALLRDCEYTPPELLAPLFYDLSTRTWQFGGVSAGHHLAPLTTAEMEKFIVGVTKLRSFHAKLAEPQLDLAPTAACRPSFLIEWVRRACPALQRDVNYMCTPVEDWTALLNQVKATPWPICPDCHNALVGYCEQSRRQLWVTILTAFS